METTFNLSHMVARIIEMHTKFGIHNTEEHVLSAEETKFRVAAMWEEFEEGKTAESKEEEFDALIDLAVFALGTIDRMGISDQFVPVFNTVPVAKTGHTFDDLEKMIHVVAYEMEQQPTSLEQHAINIAYLMHELFAVVKAKGYGDIFMAGYNLVQDANCAKELGANTNKEGGRGAFKIDLRKPEGWKAPDHSQLIESLA